MKLDNKLTPKKILLIEDNPKDADLLLEYISEFSNRGVEISTASSLDEGKTVIERIKPDIILLDLDLPDSKGTNTYLEILSLAKNTPIIALTEVSTDPDTEEKILKLGANELLTKLQINPPLLVKTITHTFERHNLQKHFLDLVNCSPDGIIVFGRENKVLFANPAAAKTLDVKLEKLYREPFGFPITHDKYVEIEILGGIIIEVKVTRIEWYGTKAFLAVIRDITERKKAEKALEKSELRLQNILDNSPNLIFTVSNEGAIEDCNKTACLALKNPREKLVGRSILDLYDAESKNTAKEYVKNLAKGLPLQGKEIRILAKDGKRIDAELSASVVQGENGKISYFVFNHRDITAYKKVETELRESEEMYRTYFENSADVVFTLDKNGLVTSLSPSVTKVLGYAPEEAIGKHFLKLEFLTQESFDVAKSNFDKVMRGTITQEQERICQAKNGEKKHVILNTSPIIKKGSVTGVLGVARDVTDQKKLEEMEKGLIHADKIMIIGQLAAGIAHEINNPSAFVMANLSNMQRISSDLHAFCGELLKLFSFLNQGAANGIEITPFLTKVPGFLNELTDMIKESMEGMERIKSIVRDLRVFSRIGKDELEPANINDLIDIAANMTYNEIKHRARLEKILDQIPPSYIDKAKIAQVLVNLLLNAAQSITKDDSKQNKIKISSKRDGNDIVISIEDTGCGIPEKIINKIFEPFFTTKPKEIGTGLGLTLCADIVHKHGGDIFVRSKVGKGSCFTVKLPIKEQPPECVTKKESPAPVPKEKARILIVDDELLLLKALKRNLSEDYHVTTAPSSEKALKIMKTKSFDAIICDIVMPGMGGLGFFKLLKEKSPSLAEKIIFCSGSGLGTKIKQLKDTIPNPVLEKPISIEALKECVRKIVSR